MKSMKANGQVLSEKEMREVKGGYIREVNWVIKVCEMCGTPYKEDDVEIKGGTYIYTCHNCGNSTEAEIETK